MNSNNNKIWNKIPFWNEENDKYMRKYWNASRIRKLKIFIITMPWITSGGIYTVLYYSIRPLFHINLRTYFSIVVLLEG